jgi:hypothetical protein
MFTFGILACEGFACGLKSDGLKLRDRFVSRWTFAIMARMAEV